MQLHRIVFLAIAAFLLAACNGEDGLDRPGGGGANGGNGNTGPGTPNTGPSWVLKVGELTAVEGLHYEYQLTPPADAKNVVFKAEAMPDWLTLDAETGLLSGTPSAEDVTAHAPLKVIAMSATSTFDDEGVTTISAVDDSMVVLHVAALDNNQKVDFYDTPFDGKAREYRNDLSNGDLKGEVQFLQTHAAAPSKDVNYFVDENDELKSQYTPNIVALRETLLLFIPEKDVLPVTVHVRVSAPGKEEKVFSMAHPNDLFAVDKSEVSQLQYSKRAWSIKLPWDYIRGGLSLEFVTDQDAPDSRQGSLPQENIDIDKATHIEFQTLRLGMLTKPHVANANEHYNLHDPIMAATDYFQTLPASKLIMSSYADVYLPSTIVNQNNKARVYDVESDDPNDHASDSTNADVYSGDMRENVGKSQVSVGINMANYGLTSWDLTQNYPHFYKSITSHHARGMYKCDGRENCPENGQWIVGHGLSGGNGIGTIYASSGNEASHEWGHAYGLGHYPGFGAADGRWAMHNPKTGWALQGHRNRLRSNVYQVSADKNVTQEFNGNTMQFKNGGFMYAFDSMSGGNFNGSPYSKYAFYAGLSAQIIQRDLNKFYVPDVEYKTGYKEWDVERGEYVEAAPTHNDVPYPVPVASGVPVATILGGYDPEGERYQAGEKRAVIYPVFHGNYGKVYDLPEPNLNDGNDQCWVEVKGAGGNKRIAVNAKRHSGGSVNQLHFNLEASFKPTSATLFCRHDGEQTELAHTVFDPEIPALPPVAIVGQEHGYEQLKTREMAEISAGIMALAPGNVMQADADLLAKIESYDAEDLAKHLDPSAWSYVEELLSITQNTAKIGAVINYHEAKGDDAQTLKQALADYLIDAELADNADALLPKASVMYGFWGPYAAADTAYLSTVPAEDGRLYVKPVGDSDEAQQEMEKHRWVMDKQGRIHPERDLSLCLTAANPVRLSACDAKSVGQKWAYNDNQTLQANGGTGQCIDNHASQGNHLNMYGCTGGWNQRWHFGERHEDLWFAFSDASVIKQVLSILAR